MDFGLKGKIAFVTGSSAGIGRQAAVLFGQLGAKVAVTFHSDEAGAAVTVEEIKRHGSESDGVMMQAIAVRYDLESPDSIKAAVDAVVAKWGRIDVFVANAVKWQSFSELAPLHTTPVDSWLPVIRHNIEGVFRTLQLVVSHMLASTEGDQVGWGRIILVSSNLAEVGMPFSSPYATAKSALRGLAKVMAAELGPRGVLVNVVMPGLTSTERTMTGRVPEQFIEPEARSTPTGRLSTPDDVAKVIVFLGSGANGNTTGQIIAVDGGKA